MSSINGARIIISERELISPRLSGGRLRAFCHLHGGDHQRSLSIQTSGEYTGFGECFNCHARVLVYEMNVEAATRMDRAHGQPWDEGGLARLGGADIASSPSKWVVEGEPPVEVWKQEEHALLGALHRRMQRAIAWSPRAREYLAARGIPLRVAQVAGVGYLSSAVFKDRALLNHPTYQRFVPRLYRWRGRVVFPLVKGLPDGKTTTRGYIGRTLRLWEPGIDEDQHKELLDTYNAQVEAENEGQACAEPGQGRRYPIRRWVKTEPAGWWYDPGLLGACVVMVEGAFDKLALLTAIAQLRKCGRSVSLAPGDVIALAGTAASASLLPPQVQSVVLALDLDSAGLDSWTRLRDGLSRSGRRVYPCPPSADGRGKDWSARWSYQLQRASGGDRPPTPFDAGSLDGFLARLAGEACDLLCEGVRPVFDAYAYALAEVPASCHALPND